MADNKRIEELIKHSGYKKQYIASQLGVSRQAFSRKLHGSIRWSAEDIVRIKDLFKLTSDKAFDIFFDRE
jgi:plasmid maintenance system antidote protein VapI